MQPSSRLELRDLGIFVAHPHDQCAAQLLRCLHRLGCRTSHVWPAPERLPEPVDLLFCAMDRQVLPLTSALSGQPQPAVIGIVAGDDADLAKLLATVGPHAILPQQFEDSSVVASMIVARANFGYQRRLLARVSKLEETLRSMRKVERAKAILMETRHLDESAAYALLRKQAMSKRVPIGVVASVVIDSNELLPNE